MTSNDQVVNELALLLCDNVLVTPIPLPGKEHSRFRHNVNTHIFVTIRKSFFGADMICFMKFKLLFKGCNILIIHI